MNKCLSSWLLVIALASGVSACGGGSDDAVSTQANREQACQTDSAACKSAGSDNEESGSGDGQFMLLGSSRGASYASTFCEGKGDDAILPQDPRELIRPGVNEGRAVAFNAYWQSCAEASGNPNTQPGTCGEFRERREKGLQLMRTELAMSLVPADYFNQLWIKWGLPGRPENFDAQLRERYGLAEADFHNPYPVEGEDPNATEGGSGRLPAGMTQIKDENGNYTGSIGLTCDWCHSGGLDALGETTGDRFVSGLGNHNMDGQLLLADVLAPALPIALSSTRGVTNAMGLSGFLVNLVDYDSTAFDPVNAVTKVALMQLPSNTTGGGDNKMPAWWNASHRPRKFWDAGYSYDAMRLDNVILQVGIPVANPGPAGGKAMRDLEPHAVETQIYLDSLQAPAYPGGIDTDLAEQGAILFHVKDLWAGDGNADIPKPPTNGSCAGCHGVYSPHFVNDDAFLEDPRLAGMAGYISPMDQIRTDPARVEGFTQPLYEIMSTGWLSYPEGAEGYVSPEDKDPVTEALDDYEIFTPGSRPRGACNWQGANPEDVTGYLSPPLHGIWATAPYLHNGSVPDVWSLLKPSERPDMWRRQLSEGAGPERGYATSLDAYDQERLGWKHDVLTCGEGLPYYQCEPEGVPEQFTGFLDLLIGLTGTLNSVGYQTVPPIGRQGVEDRKIFNTHLFGKGNSGHDFGQVLTDTERHAIIEYLKTL